MEIGISDSKIRFNVSGLTSHENRSPMQSLRQYFQSGATRPLAFRLAQLKKLKQAVLAYEQEIYAALRSDLNKSPEEAWVTEIGLVIKEINYAIKYLPHWIKPERRSTDLVNLPSSSYIVRDPLGTVLVIGPWNFPFMLTILPVVGAIAAGNTMVVKPSEFAPATSTLIGKLLRETFSPDYILFREGEGAVVVPELVKDFRFDHIFYTGSTVVGKIIYKMAAEQLTPVTLELGGKGPCVVEADANIRVAARRIAVTKFSNAGQMCVSPDYLLVHESVRESFIEEFRKATLQFFGEKPEENPDYVRIINHRQFDRQKKYLEEGRILMGGRVDREKLFIAPTLMDEVSPEALVMKEEIFGPILPLFSFTDKEKARALIQQNPDPLCFYVFTASDRKAREWQEAVPAGTSAINNASWQFTNHHLPFGGRGASGIGKYHGYFSFETFTHARAVLKTPTWFDPNIKYPPMKGRLGLFKKVVR